MPDTEDNALNATKPHSRAWIIDLLLMGVLLIGAYFRWVGINWGEYQYLHPDERFLVWVGTDITPMKCSDPNVPIDACPPDQQTWMSLGEYFNTAASTLNPHNRGHGFYVYGTLPMFLTRFVVQWIYGHSGFNEMTDVGRPLSALMDLLTVYLVFLIAARLYDRRVAILAAAFSAGVVLQIQQAHFFTMDTFLNFFTYLAIYFAIRVSLERWPQQPSVSVSVFGQSSAAPQGAALPPPEVGQVLRDFVGKPFFKLSIAFGIALGLAVASKLNAAPVAIMLPAAFGLTLLSDLPGATKHRWLEAFGYLCLAAVVSVLVFRVFQPYAFSGPGFLGVKPNPLWVANIREQRIQAGGDVDFPPAIQWARRPIWFSAQNMVLWGLGAPLGLLAWAAFLWMGWRLLKGDWQRHALLWGWVAFYFTWQSLAFNPTMRYQLPVYPALTIFAAWGVFALYDLSRSVSGKSRRWWKLAAWVVGSGVLLATFAWAFAFTRIYTQPITRIAAARWIYQNVPGAINLHIQTGDGFYNQPVPYPYGYSITPDQPYLSGFTAQASGEVSEIYFAHIVDINLDPEPKTLKVEISLPGVNGASGDLLGDFLPRSDPRGEGYTVKLDQPFYVAKGAQYALQLAISSGVGNLTLVGAAPANESSWDDGEPLRVDGYDGYSGIYQPGLNFEMYWDDNADKLQRFVSTLDQADYLFITSNRQWGSLPRLPERFPLTIAYYRNLLGCPAERSIEWCYRVAQPGMFSGNLGFELVQVFQSDPSIGPIRINDQFAEEAFTVYDHPKVLIFRKTAEYNPQRVREILGAVDLSLVVHVTPKRAASYPANLMLPEERWATQQDGGTWSQLFPPNSLQNRHPLVAVVLWYGMIFLLGLLAYPFIHLALPGLADHGYPLARITGLLLLSYLVWLAGSEGIPFNRLTIALALLLMLVVALSVAFSQRDELRRAWREHRGYYLLIEGLFLAFFVFDLLIRLGNPDLWHPWKGGEKPMDFSYLNAVLKSTTFPPYDPWYAGGYLNYYYYGFVIMGVPVKFLGITPAVAYNLILPTTFAMIAMGAFSLGWNLTVSSHGKNSLQVRPVWIGLAASLGMAVFGNLGTVKMIYQGYQRIAAPGGVIEGAGLLTRWVWALRGAVLAFTGTPLPYAIGDWYWNPSRVIPAPGDVEPITEFPFFTVLYGDPHAHLFALPITLLVLSFALGVVLGRARWKGALGAVAAFLLGGLAVGALRPTNTWDFYPYLVLGCVGLGYSLLVYPQSQGRLTLFLKGLPTTSRRALLAIGGVLLLIIASHVLYKPFMDWYGQGYSKVDMWKGTHTTLNAYLTHGGLFLFVIVSWMVWETRDWMANTPVSSLRKLDPYRGWIQAGLGLLLGAVLALLYLQVAIAWVVLPLAAWAGILLLRPALSDAKRFVLFLIGTGLMLTLMVEVIVLRGDVGRMNTVFKFYLQVWTLFSVSAAAALGWVLSALPGWLSGWRFAWRTMFTALVAGAALFTLLGGMAKIKDRMAPQAPHTLDGMAFMQYAQYTDTWGTMDLSQDYRAIRWMQENVKGSPVIVEANLRDLYRWGSRFSIYTGLPGVVGWEWHQQQQRALLPPNWVSDRISEIEQFYTTEDLQLARSFLQKYGVRYIILGQQERGKYPGPGLEKFAAANGSLWREVYRDAETVIYAVIN